MRAAFTAVFVAGLSAGLWAGVTWGKARSRQQRAWNDFLGNKDAMRGHWLRAVEEWKRAAKVAIVLVALLAGVVLAVAHHG